MIGLTSVFESLPDIFTLVVLQLVVIKYFEATGILLFPVAGSFGEQPYVLPILILAIIPSIQMFSIIHLFVKDELSKPYITLAKSKGYTRTYIFFIHLIRNIIPNIFNHSKSVILLLLSSLIVLERLFNLQGLNTYLFTYPEPNIIAFSLIMLYLPIFGFYLLINGVTVWKTGQRVEM
ncbi:ABC transporter permease subunit [Falsibacillus pallidus]|uniref:Binding-protein-dependent transport system inner membrane component n=1 Tax=Falsibacillus pallidus TaxID=493781 RepID=A0A370GQD6_9BACI|nr:ABC transporter permease subunit [Falsibacillus pallidus]RDI45530.1 binding-protein-dependent transport system inner membrane component [Falsibacillus pallidus]